MLKMKIILNVMKRRIFLNLNLFSKDSVSGHKMRRHKNKCDSNDIFIDKDGEVLIQGGAFRINYTVTNPKQHYIRFGVGREVLGHFIDNKLAEEDKENLDILNVIKSMDLPISIKNIESVKIRK